VFKTLKPQRWFCWSVSSKVRSCVSACEIILVVSYFSPNVQLETSLKKLLMLRKIIYIMFFAIETKYSDCLLLVANLK